MFTIETGLIKKTLVEWFNKKIKWQHLELDLLEKTYYERKHQIDWQTNKCVICKMLLKVDRLGYDVPNDHFFLRYEHKFLGNIYSDPEIAELTEICTL